MEMTSDAILHQSATPPTHISYVRKPTLSMLLILLINPLPRLPMFTTPSLYSLSLTLINPTLLDNLPHSTIILPPILIIQSTRLRIGRTGRIGITQQALNTSKYRRYVVDWTPLIL